MSKFLKSDKVIKITKPDSWKMLDESMVIIPKTDKETWDNFYSKAKAYYRTEYLNKE